MKQKIILLLVICAFYSPLFAQNPESVVREYVRLLNDWLASPYDTQKKEKVLSLLQNGDEKCTMKDEIVEKYNSDAGISRCMNDTYLSILNGRNQQSTIHLGIISLKNKSDNEGIIVTAIMKYSGGIDLITAADYWISGNKITYIVSNDREILKIKRDENNAQHTYIDLGLPSGTLWATCNVGANYPWEYGDYFAWGETKPKTEYSMANYKYAKENKLIKYNDKTIYGYNGFADWITQLEPMDDAAYQNWGSDWCMPTQNQCKELIDNCNWSWVNINDVNGYEIKGRNGNTIFLPAAGSVSESEPVNKANIKGYYWSSTYNYEARFLSFTLTQKIIDYFFSFRQTGLAIRPVRANKK